MFARCHRPIWTQDDFTACFQREFLQVLLPLIVCGVSFFHLSISFLQRTLKQRQKNDGGSLNNSDGNLSIPARQHPKKDQLIYADSEDGHDGDDRLTLQRSISRTNDSIAEVNRPRGQLMIVVLEISALLGEVGIDLVALLTHAWGQDGTLAAVAGFAIWAYIFVLAALRLLPRTRLQDSLPKLWNHTAVLYSFQWLFTVLLFRSAIINPRSLRARSLMIADFALATILLLIALTTRKGNRAVVLVYEDNIEPSKEPLASLLSLGTFGWVDGIVWQGFWRPLELQDVWNLTTKDKAANVIVDFRQLKKTSRLAWHLMKYFRGQLAIQFAWAFFSGLFTFVPTLLLKAILEYVENPEQTPANAAWFYVFLLALSAATQGVSNGQALWIGRKICIRLRAIIGCEIYAKALRRKAAAASDTVLGEKKKTYDEAQRKNSKSFFGRKKKGDTKPQEAEGAKKDPDDAQVNVGTIINLMAVDSVKVSEVCAYLHFIFAEAPVQLVIAIVLLYQILGYSSIAGIGVMILLLPVNIFIAKQFSTRQKKIMAATDQRIQTTNEILQNIRIIKYFAWEERFGQIVNEKRRVELRALRNRYIVWAFAVVIWYGAPILITFLSFLIYTVVEKRDLVPSVAFTALSLFSLLRVPLDQIADMLANIQDATVSVNRVEEFLNEEETEKYTQLADEKRDDNGQVVIGFDKATFTWGSKDAQGAASSSAFRMIDMSVKFHVGRLNIIAGPTGSGKTSLLMALLGEMTVLTGEVFLPGGRCREDLKSNPDTGLAESVAYCAQQAWLVNDTIKQNILFAAQWDNSRYKSVIAACALERDLEVLDAGDNTLVGEKGITLSGGQKQRISLARALYSTSRHVLLDDCLSAVDSHTAKHIFDQCIMGPLMLDRTCILVTHNTALTVPQSHYVVVLANGKISSQGSPDEVLASGALGEDIMSSRPTSKSGSQMHSRVHSTARFRGDSTGNGEEDGHTKPGNGKAKEPAMNGSAKKHLGTESVDNANARTEGKAEGGVKSHVIKMYLSSMGPWYFWVIVFFTFVAQQVTSVATNVWIRQWSNSYPIKKVNELGFQRDATTAIYASPVAYVYSPSCFLKGSCAWDFGLFSNQSFEAHETRAQATVDVNYYLGIYALIGIIYLVVSFFREGILFWGSLTASWKIHARLFESVTRAKLRFFDTTPLGQLMNRFSKDIQSIDQDVAPIAIGFIHCMASVVTIVILISAITPRFLIAGVFISAIYFAIGFFYVGAARDLKRLESVQRSPLYQQFGETLTGVTTIRAYGDERRFIRENQSRINAQSRPFIYLWACNRWLALRIDLTGALVSFFAGIFVILSVGSIDAGAAGLSLTYAVTFSESVLWLVRLYGMNEQNMNSVERVKEYLAVEQEARAIIPENRPASNWPSRGAVEFLDYTTRYRTDLEPVLKKLSFKIPPSEKVGIVGRTGAGKSSLALALFRGLEADCGKILIDDVDISLIGLQDLRESITIVPQDPTLFTGTIRSNLDPFGLFTDEEIFTALRRVHLIDAPTSTSTSKPSTPIIHELTPPSSPSSNEQESESSTPKLAQSMTNTHENTNIFETLSSSVTESGSNLSQGQRQLLCLARALIKSPRVLLMDEATASIDYNTDAKIQETLRELQGSTIITIAHRLQTIVDYDKVLVLDKGEVIEYDAPWELLKRDGGIFKGMCEMSGDLAGLMEGARKAEAKKKLVDV